MSLQANYSEILSRIQSASQRSEYNEEVRLVVVTKTIEPPIIDEVVKLGASRIAENRVQEIQRKYEQIARIEELEFHLIGSLQTNKVKYIIDKVALIHSLDRYDLAKEINRQAQKNGKVQKCLLQIKVSEEESKKGMATDEVFEFAQLLRDEFPNIKICGVMGMAPYFDEPQKSRPYFQKLRNYFDELKNRAIFDEDFTILSMGMSNDFEVAIEEGANMVRIGSAIFEEN